jgi:mannose-6-phosphate isomerase-like protein (cupin superfamily)
VLPLVVSDATVTRLRSLGDRPVLGTVIRIRPGDTVYTPPGEEHWHGATDTNMMSHLALLERPEDGDGTTWLEPVTDDEYAAAHRP